MQWKTPCDYRVTHLISTSSGGYGAETPPSLVGMEQKLHQFWWEWCKKFHQVWWGWSRNSTSFGGYRTKTPPVLVGMGQNLHQFWWEWGRNSTKFGGNDAEIPPSLVGMEQKIPPGLEGAPSFHVRIRNSSGLFISPCNFLKIRHNINCIL